MSTPSTPTTSLSPSSQGAFPPADRDRILDLVFDPTTGLGLEIARYNVGGSGWTSRDGPNFRAGAGVPSYQGPDGIYDWTQDAAQRAILLGARILQGLGRFGMIGGIGYHLHHTRPVAQVDEGYTAVISLPVNPPGQCYNLTDIF